ncbi:hypothetical protein QOT17_011974 [Balamuthia mandrillaris]
MEGECAPLLINYPVTLLEFLQTLPIETGTRSILCYNPPGFPCTARGKTLAAIYSAFAKRLDARNNAGAASDDRRANALPCLQASPGGGKSFLLDELAALKKTDLELCESTTMREILLQSVAISITFNSSSTLESEVEKDLDPVVTRVLWAYFFSTKKMSFPTFCQALFAKYAETANTFTLETALACIRLHLASAASPSSSATLPSTPILLCVDELLKVSSAPQPDINDPQVAKALSSIGKQLNRDPYFNVVVSTLDSGPVLVEQTRSGRPITWIPLPPLTLKDSLLLFKPILDNEEDMRAKVNIALAISECGGHPRSLESLWLVLHDPPNSRYFSFPELVSLVIDRMLLVIFPMQALQIALLGIPFPLDTPIESGPHSTLPRTIRSEIASGLFLNALESAGETVAIIPRLSPLRLRQYAKFGTRDDLNKCLASMLATETNFSGLTFEHFHAWWEVLRRLLLLNSTSLLAAATFHEDRPVQLGQLYNINSDVEFLFRKKKGVMQLRNHFPCTTASAVFAADGKELSLKDLTSYVLMPATGNPGFDITLIEQKPDNRGYIVINIECRYSHPTSGTQLTTSELERKWELMQQQFQPLFTRSYGQKPKELYNMQLKLEDVYLVVCAIRQSALVLPDSLPQLLVLGREKLQELYSPTLAMRSQFLSGPEWESLMHAAALTTESSLGQGEKYDEAELSKLRIKDLKKILAKDGHKTSFKRKADYVCFIIQHCYKPKPEPIKRKRSLSPVEEEEEKEKKQEKATKAKDIKGKEKQSQYKKPKSK